MKNNWTELKVKDIAMKMADAPFGSNLKTKDYVDDGVLVIQGKNIDGRVMKWGDLRFVTKEKFDTLKNHHAHKGAIVFPKVGTIGKVGVLTPYNGESEYLLSTNTMMLEPDFNQTTSLFIYYFFSNPKTRRHIEQSSTSSVQPVFNFTALKNYSIKLPPLPEQKRIAHILGSLDDKIELNRQMNQTLEQMAQALFKSWFVDFDPVIDNALAAGMPIPEELQAKAEKRRLQSLSKQGKDRKALPEEIQKLFPSDFEYSEELEKWVPRGWRVKVLEEIITLIGGGTPKTSIAEYWNGDIPWFSVVDAPNDSDVFVIDTEKKVTQLGVDKSSTKLLRKGTTIISARGTVGKCALVGFPMTMNQSCYGIQGKDGATDIFTYYAIKESVSNLQQRGHGSVFNTITRDTFRSIKLAFADNKLCKSFDDTTEPYLNRIKNNLIQNNELTKLRDTLLPKLISGEVRVPTDSTISE